MAAAVRDPVCGMPVDPANARSFELEGARYWFCSEYCLNAFRWNPHAYVAAARARPNGEMRPREIAYLSMEVAIDPRMPTYSGGLGVLASDTLRSCADLGLPVIGITLLHRKGYFSQALDDTGGQIEREETWDPERCLRPLSARAQVSIEGRTVHVRAWQYDIAGARGVVPLLLLDTDLPDNAEGDRRLTGMGAEGMGAGHHTQEYRRNGCRTPHAGVSRTWTDRAVDLAAGAAHHARSSPCS